jgi:hypothetical protein
MTLSRAELARHLSEHVYFLQSSAAAFDAGSIVEGKRLAVSLRVLLHDTTNSHALLGQLIDLNRQVFPCVNAQAVDENAIFAAGGMYLLGGPTLEAKTVMSMRTAPFPNWWTEIVGKSPDVSISRRAAILALSNQGGGAHVDPRTNTLYRNVVEDKAVGWIFSDDANPEGTKVNPYNDPLPFIVRAVAAEVLHFLSATT